MAISKQWDQKADAKTKFHLLRKVQIATTLGPGSTTGLEDYQHYNGRIEGAGVKDPS